MRNFVIFPNPPVMPKGRGTPWYLERPCYPHLDGLAMPGQKCSPSGTGNLYLVEVPLRDPALQLMWNEDELCSAEGISRRLCLGLRLQAKAQGFQDALQDAPRKASCTVVGQ